MTREEAIEYLKRADVTVGKKIKTKTAEALEMAIKALEQEPVLDKIRAEIEQMPSELTTDGRRMVRRGSVFRIIDKYNAESEDKQNED